MCHQFGEVSSYNNENDYDKLCGDIRYSIPSRPNIAGDASPVALTPAGFNHIVVIIDHGGSLFLGVIYIHDDVGA